MAYTQRMPVRFEDVDYAQIVYFPRLFSYCHRAFEDFFAKEAGLPYADLLQRRRTGFPTVHAEADFRSPLRFGDTCRVVMETVKLGTRSATHRYRLYKGESGTVCAEMELVTVAMNLDRYEAVDIPDDVKAAFSSHLVGYTSG